MSTRCKDLARTHAIALCAALAPALLAAAGYAGSPAPPSALAATSAPAIASVACPRHVVALPRTGARKSAERAALEQAPRVYRGLDLAGRTASGAYVVRPGTHRSADAGRCHLYGKTVLVELRFPRELPSSSLSDGAVYV